MNVIQSDRNTFRRDDNFLNFLHHQLQKLVSPRSRREDEARHELLLNIILLASIALMIILCGTLGGYLLLYGHNAYTISLTITVGILTTFLTFFFLSRRGYHVLSAHLLILFFFIPTTFALYRWGIGLSIALLSCVLMITMSSILINTRYAFILTVIIAFVLTSFTYLQAHGIINPDTNWRFHLPQIKDAVELSVIFLVIILVNSLSTREIENSLRRTRRSEKALEKERNLLEIRVAENTKALRELQRSQLNQLHHLAQFGQLAAGYFHDLVNPLSAATLYLEEAKTGATDKIDDVKENLGHTFVALQRLEQLVGTIQKQLKNTADITTFSVAEEISEAVSVLNYKALKNNTDIIFRPPTGINLIGNATVFFQVILNLLSTIIDCAIVLTRSEATNPETRFTIRIHLQQNEQKQNEKDVVVNFLCTGLQLPADLLQCIFDQHYFTGENDLSLAGFVTVKNSIERYLHGTIRVNNTSGGAIFDIHLPSPKKSQ